MNYISELSKFPQIEHYAALVFESIYIEGDERSRTNPGHGYPAHTESVVRYITFKDTAEMEEWVNKREHPSFGRPERNYKIIKALPLTVTLTTKVNIK
jgi:hypothetical protein